MSLLSTIAWVLPGSAERPSTAAPAGMVPAEKIAATAKRNAAAKVAQAPLDRDLVTQRDRLTEQFTLGQAELGGIFYEMAIRDHVRLDVLTKKAAALQRIDTDLAEVQRALDEDRR